jgi:NitT/TauT family transport system substrate-binding protein
MVACWSCCVGLLAQDVQLVEARVAGRSRAGVRAGQLDAISHHEPVMTHAGTRSDVRMIADTRSLKGSQELFGGPVVGPCLYAPADFLQKHPQTVQAMANAVVHALKWLQTAGPSDIIKVVPEPTCWVTGACTWRRSTRCAKPSRSTG